MARIVILASGNGTNAEAIINHLRREGGSHEVVKILANKAGAGVFERARRLTVPAEYHPSQWFKEGDSLLRELKAANADLVVLAGFLLKVPVNVVDAFPGRIANIHPALLPSYGGKGMYGDRVHEAVLKAGEKESGITIHLVDNHYDHGGILVQARCRVLPGDTAETLATRIHALEHRYFPVAVAQLASESDGINS